MCHINPPPTEGDVFKNRRYSTRGIAYIDPPDQGLRFAPGFLYSQKGITIKFIVGIPLERRIL